MAGGRVGGAMGETRLGTRRVPRAPSPLSFADDAGRFHATHSLAPAQVAPVLTPTALTSLLPSSVFHEMRYFKVLSPQGAEMQLFVLGTARMPREGSIHGTVIEIVTQVGHVILDDELLYIEHEDASHMFMRAGFPVSNSTSSTGGRALLGIFELMGFFNAIEGLVLENAVDGMTMPKLNDKMLYAEIEEGVVLSLIHI